MHIGLVGGIGPAATVAYYRALVASFAAARRKLPLTIINADVRELTANLMAGQVAEQAEIFADCIDRLRAGGCEIAAITSMAGHFCIGELERTSSLPLVSAISALDTYFAQSGAARVGVMGTRAVMESGLYGIRSVEVIAPPSEDLAAVHQAYLDIALAGTATPKQRSFFHEMGLRLFKEQSAEIIVLGGTDLSLAFQDTDPEYPVVDSALVHADAIARVALAG